MSRERLSQEISSQVEVLQKTTPEEFSEAYNSCVEFNVPEKLLENIATNVNNGVIIGVVIPHQSFADVEVIRQFCEKVNEKSPSKEIEAYEAYSMPAVGKIKAFFESRKKEYKKRHLNMLGFIRNKDRVDEDYSKNITPEMEEENKENLIKLNKVFKRDQGCLVFIPFESTLQSGRINPETGEINGMQKVSPEDSLFGNLIKKRKKRKIKILSCGIDGGWSILSPGSHSFSNKFINLLKNKKKSDEKIVTVNADNELIDISNSDKEEDQIFEEVVTNVAKKMPKKARGYYGYLVK